LDIILSGIRKSFGESSGSRQIFRDLDAVFPSRKFSVIMGKSGMGKSTLLNLISGIDLPDAGSVRIGGIDVTAMDDAARTVFRRRRMGIVFQFFNLIPVLSVMDNVTLIARMDGMPRKEASKRALDLLSRTGMAGREKAFPDTLSGGEQQRVAIVRALVNDPPLLLADEPTGNLDQENGLAVLRLLAALAGEQGKTLVMVTHSPEALGFADQVLVVENFSLAVRAPGPGGA
jgi:putative ABC transport system ATP-binding protein